MALYLGILIFSFIITSIAIVPFIDFLYHHRHQSPPTGGGLLIIIIVTLLYALLLPIMNQFGVYITHVLPISEEINILFFTFLSFGCLGLYAGKHKLIIEIILSLIISSLLFFNLKITILNFPYLGILHLGWLYIPIATLIILIFVRAFKTTDSFDGLSSGVLLISLLAFWIISVASLDTPLSTFIALWAGSLIAFLYFNIYPSRIRLGSVGALAFGATFAVVGLLLGKIIALIVIGGIFVVQALCNLFHISLPYILKAKGWEEPKIMMRTWLAAIILAIFGLWLAYL